MNSDIQNLFKFNSAFLDSLNVFTSHHFAFHNEVRGRRKVREDTMYLHWLLYHHLRYRWCNFLYLWKPKFFFSFDFMWKHINKISQNTKRRSVLYILFVSSNEKSKQFRSPKEDNSNLKITRCMKHFVTLPDHNKYFDLKSLSYLKSKRYRKNCSSKLLF